jgi:iron complex outermembrane recepter protein
LRPDSPKIRISYRQTLKPTLYGPREVNVGVLGTNLLNDDIRNSVSFTKDEVLMPGIGVRVFAKREVLTKLPQPECH